MGTYRPVKKPGTLTLAFTVDADRREPIIPKKIPLLLRIGNVTMSVGVDVPFGESEIDQVYHSVVGCTTNCTVSKLNIAMQDFPVMHRPKP
jgi:NADPH-dependent glutamate synthase beta subunit-like oxidoreductase